MYPPIHTLSLLRLLSLLCLSSCRVCWGSTWSDLFRLLYPRKYSLFDPDIDEWLHWLGVLVRQQSIETANICEVDETSVELSICIDIPEDQPVSPVQVCIASEHLLVHVLNFGLKALGKARGLAEPVVAVCCNLSGIGQCWCGCEGVCWEQRWVEDLAVDPGLNVTNVRWSRKIHWVPILVDPSICSTVPWISMRVMRTWKHSTHLPAVIVGQVCSLHRGRPLVGSTSWTILTIPASNLYCSATAYSSQSDRCRRDSEATYVDELATLLLQPPAA